ncbi:MAG: F0F1 ATP synthase subunit B [Gammaproteobacteria bacterium]|jgi:F-type H+-transporting ATPase subunit b|nr:F0F1 ATP synthase subunit B [Gammaproteobacteria bacterium]
MNINLTLIAQAVTFFAFIWFTVKFVWPPILAAIEERRTKIADGLAAADKGARSLEDAQVKITAMVEEARGQARSILDQAQTRANGIVDEARTSATEERERILQSAQAEVQQQINRARDELRAQVASITVAGAEKILAREIDARAHQDLLDKLAAQI